jgi:ribosome-binding factor A
MKRGYDRTRRVADLVQRTLAQLLLQNPDDERFRLVTITDVTVSKDLSFAKVYVSMLFDEAEQIREILAALNRSAKSLRFQLAKAVQLRIVPEIRFYYDESTAKGFRVSDLIDSAIKKENK